MEYYLSKYNIIEKIHNIGTIFLFKNGKINISNVFK